jgi:hypothetical protein
MLYAWCTFPRKRKSPKIREKSVSEKLTSHPRLMLNSSRQGKAYNFLWFRSLSLHLVRALASSTRTSIRCGYLYSILVFDIFGFCFWTSKSDGTLSSRAKQRTQKHNKKMKGSRHFTSIFRSFSVSLLSTRSTCRSNLPPYHSSRSFPPSLSVFS